MKKILFAVMAAALFASCSQDDMSNGGYDNESDIKVSVKDFEYDGDAAGKSVARAKGGPSRVALKYDGSALKFSWQLGDQVGVFGATDNQQVGLKMKNINSENNLSAIFESNDFKLDGGKSYMAYYPLINDVYLEPIIPVDYTGQVQTANNSTDHLGAKDYIFTPWTTAAGENNVSFTFQHISAVLWLNIKMPDNTTAYKSVTLSAADNAFTTAAKIKLADVEMALDGSRQYISPKCITAKTMNSSVTLNFNGTVKADENNMLNAWMMVLPADFTNRELTVMITPETGEGDPIVYTINPGKNFLSGKAYKLTIENVDNDNPGDTGNWPDEDIELDPGYITSNTPTWVSDADGWTVNVDNYGNGGWGTYVTYTNNGMMNGLLTSKGGSAFYYQWGRWLGFPSTCSRTIINSGGSASGNYPNSSQYLNGVDIYNTNYGYIFNSGLVCSYAACWMGNTSWTRTRALNSSIIFGMVSGMTVNPLDYIGANESCKWEDRCGNPAPDGYRIPTAAELETFIPAAKTINSSLKELKVIKGIKYAMRWKVVTSGSVPYVEIRSVKVANSVTNANTVADATFDAANPVRFAAYGFMDNEAGLQQRGSYGVYWSSDTGKNTLGGTSGYGGKCLEIDFSGSKATMGMTVAPRCFGIPVLLIKDSNAKAESITPWFPLR